MHSLGLSILHDVLKVKNMLQVERCWAEMTLDTQKISNQTQFAFSK